MELENVIGIQIYIRGDDEREKNKIILSLHPRPQQEEK